MILRISVVVWLVLACVSAARADLIGHWRFDETSGAVAADSAGSNNGTIQSGVTVGQVGISGGAFDFDGTTNARVEMGNASFLADILHTGGSSLNTYTYSGWVNFTALAGGGSLVFAGNNAGSSDYSNLAAFDDQARAWLRGSGGANRGPVGPVISDGNWHHLALAVSPTSSILYVDASPIDTENISYTAINTANSFEVGRLGRGSPADFFNGLIDDVQVYDTTLDGNDVSFLFNNPGQTISGIPEPATLTMALVLSGLGLAFYGWRRMR